MTNFEEDYENEDNNECDEYDEEYNVGYGKPPRHTRFKKGESGNPKGRPKPPENMSDAIAKAFSSYIEIKENGKIKRVKAMEAIAKKVLAEALKGNSAILRKILDSKMLDQNLLKMAFRNYNHDYKKDVKPFTKEQQMLIAGLKTIMDEKIMEEQKAEREKREQELYK